MTSLVIGSGSFQRFTVEVPPAQRLPGVTAQQMPLAAPDPTAAVDTRQATVALYNPDGTMAGDTSPAARVEAALRGIGAALREVNRAIETERPQLAVAAWDFSDSHLGLSVTPSSASEADRRWLQAQLNHNPTLTAAVRSLVGAVADDLEARPDPTGQFADVKAQLSAKIDFRSLFAQAILQPREEASKTEGHATGRAVIESFAKLLLAD